MNTYLKLLTVLCLFLPNISYSQDWKPLPLHLPGASTTGLYVGKTTPFILVSTYNHGIFRSTNQGKSWLKTSTDEDTIFSLYAQSDAVLFAGGKGNFFKSLDSGKTWKKHAFPQHIALSHFQMLSSGILVAGTGSKWDFFESIDGYGIWFSLDTGRTWQVQNNGIVNLFPQVEGIAELPDGTLLTGVYNKQDFGLGSRQSILALSKPEGQWERVSINVSLPSGELFQDAQLRIDHVNALYLSGANVVAAVSGVYTNFAVGFTISKPYAKIKDAETPWTVIWVKSSLPADGGFFDQLTTNFTDSKKNTWTSLSLSSSGFNSKAFQLHSGKSKWQQKSEGLPLTIGSLFFGEDGKGNLYTLGYYSGDTVYTRTVEDPLTSVAQALKNAKMLAVVSQNGLGDDLTIYAPENDLENKQVFFTVYNASGLPVFSGTTVFVQGTSHVSISARSIVAGLYFGLLESENSFTTIKFVKE